MKRHSIFVLFLVLAGASASLNPALAATPVKGGTFYRHIDFDPVTLNPITKTDQYSQWVLSYILSTLLTVNPDTYAWEPGLATKWEIAKDGKTFTFHLRKGVKWHDGVPFTADDVKFSFDVYFEGKWIAPQKKLYFEKIKEVIVIDPYTVKFIVKEPYFKNFEVVVSNFLPIIPKHFYSGADVNDPKFNKQVIGTGPYKLEEWERGQHITLKRNEDFFGKDDPVNKGWYNFDKIFFRPVSQIEVAVELLKKGNLDFIDLSRNPDQFVEKTKGEEWGPGKKLVAVKAENSAPDNFDYGFVAWNEKHPFFGDRDVRMAMSHLINRDVMIDKFRYGMSVKATGPFGNKSPSSSPKVKPVEFDQNEALKLLQKAGWKLQGEKLLKTIDGKEPPFEFTIICANPAFERYLTLMKEDMKKVGITLNIKMLEWNSFIKLIDERKFDAANMAWSVGSLESDPKQVWHSAEIAPPGHNFAGWSNKKADELIEKIERTLDPKTRRGYYHQLHEIIAAEQPYSFLFNRKYTLYSHTARIKKPKDLFKYDLGYDAWWVGE